MKKLLITTAILATLTTTAEAKDGDFLVRLRAIDVAPTESADVTVIGGSVDITNQVVPEIDFTYFFTDSIAAELIAATSKHTVHATAGNLDLGTVWALPPIGYTF